MKIAIPLIFNNYDFSRASIANYYDADGMIVEAMVDELRLGYNPTTLEFIGPIIEGEVENELLQSYRFDNASWTKIGTITTEYELEYSPGVNFLTGTDIATRYTQINLAHPLLRQAVTTGLKVFSVYAKNFTGDDCNLILRLGTQLAIFYFDETSATITGGTDAWAHAEKLQDGWYRFSVWANVAVAGYAEIELSGSPGNQCYLCAAQVEETSAELEYLPTSWIDTGATTETRAADINEDNALKVVSSNVPENDHPVWDAGDSYIVDEQVIVLGHYHRIYSSIGSNTNKFPPDHPEEWVDQGATNRWRMFDMTVGPEKQTISEGSDNTVQVLLSIDQVVNTVTLLNLYASSVRIIMRDELGNIVYDYSQDLLTGVYESTWWAFFFGARSRITSLSITDLPPYSPSTIEMILDGGDDVAKIGKMIVGSAVDIGCTRYGTSVGIIDFSRKERDAFGNNFILKRRYVDRADFDIQILTSRVDEIKQLLADVRATPVLYIGDDSFASTNIYGFYRDFSIVISGPKRSDATLQVESI
jgi:hypothetical protein